MERRRKRGARLLASCYRESLQLAAAQGIETIAFPAISTGAYAYPIELATAVAIGSVLEFSRIGQGTMEVIFCCYSVEDHETYERALQATATDPRFP